VLTLRFRSEKVEQLNDSSHPHHVVIVGAGFGGLEVADVDGPPLVRLKQ
jgi:NADH dehydrogenase FAD-containing subunit